MEPSVDNNNKRIAKNTIFLYVRMIISILISLYTSRVVLNQLGVEDFGINNVVAGVVVMFTFVNGTLASGTQRFLTFALGEKSIERQKVTFSTTFFVHLILAIILGIIILVVGTWFVYNKLNMPADRLEAAYFTFICGTIAVILSITQVPYMSSIIAHEDMKVYAYMSVFDAMAKLTVAYVLMISNFDKLKLYSLLLLIVSILNILFYRFYCMKKYVECHIHFIFDKQLLKAILGFSGWNIIGCCAVMGCNQGVNILLNIFFGPTVNAARAISMQVSSMATQLVGNFQTAVNPQIVKYFAGNELDKMVKLINNSSKYSGYLTLLVVVPLSIEVEFLLQMWLGTVPEETVFFSRIILLQTFIQTLSRPIVDGLHAVGKLKWPNILSGSNLLLILPIAYILLKCGFSLHIVMLVSIIPWIFENVIDGLLLKKYIGFPISQYYTFVLRNVILIGIVAFILPLFISHYMTMGWTRLFVVGIVSELVLGLLIYKYGISKYVRSIVCNKISNIKCSVLH